MLNPIKVLVIDDSALARQTLSKILNSDPEIEVIDTAADPIFAVQKIAKEKPDVITLDIEMPRMDGLTFLRKLMAQSPIPVVIISSLTQKGAETAIQAIEYGAVEVITKPKLATKEFYEESSILICDAVKAASLSKINKQAAVIKVASIPPKLTADAILSLPQTPVYLKQTTDKMIVIGASTGGTVALEQFLKAMPPDCPGIVIVQHMPELFTRSFANRLDSLCQISVKEGTTGETITQGKAIIAPGNKQMIIRTTGAKYFVDVSEGPLVNRHRPSVDVLFRSAAKYVGQNAIGIIMTGMGDDGAKGLLEMKEAGAYTIAQNEESCVVFGMPKVAISLGAAHIVLPLDKIAEFSLSKLKHS